MKQRVSMISYFKGNITNLLIVMTISVLCLLPLSSVSAATDNSSLNSFNTANNMDEMKTAMITDWNVLHYSVSANQLFQSFKTTDQNYLADWLLTNRSQGGYTSTSLLRQTYLNGVNERSFLINVNSSTDAFTLWSVLVEDTHLDYTNYNLLSIAEQDEVCERILQVRPSQGYETINSLQLEIDAIIHDIVTTKVQFDKNAMTIEYAQGDSAASVTQNVTLPTVGENGTTIVWSSDKPQYIASNGSVTRPSDVVGDQTVKLTATISRNGIQATIEYIVTVTSVISGTLLIENQTVNAGDTIDVPVVLTGGMNNIPLSFSFDVSYDSTKLTFKGVKLSTTTNQTIGLQSQLQLDGKMRVIGSSSVLTPLSDGQIVILEFDVNSSLLGGTTTDVALSNIEVSNGTSLSFNTSDNATLTVAKKINANLNKLVLSEGTLSPAFNKDSLIYTASVPDTVASVVVTPTVEDANATVTVNENPASQAVTLVTGTNTIHVAVTAEDGTTIKTYTITVTKTFIPANPSYGDGGGPSTPIPQPKVEDIVVDVDGGNGDNFTKAMIKRTTEPDGTVKDNVIMSETIAKETVEKAKEKGMHTARIVIADTTDKVSETRIDIPKGAVSQLSGGKLNLEISTENVVISIPTTSLQNFTDDLYFRVVPITKESERQQVEDRAKNEKVIQEVAKNDTVKVLGRPIEIETNMQSREVTLVLPLKNNLPTDSEERQKMLDNLGVFIEHSDGTKELIKGRLVKRNNEEALEFTVTKFSTFTMVYVDGFGEVNNFPGKTFTSKGNVMQDKEWTIAFSTAVDPATVNENSVYVVDGKGVRTEVEYMLSNDKKKLTVVPKKFYELNQSYDLFIMDGVNSEFGKKIVESARMSFTIAPVSLEGIQKETKKSVSSNKEWRITFNQPLDEDRVNSTNVFVIEEYGERTNTNVSLSNDGTDIVVKPEHPYESNKTYYLFIQNQKAKNGKILEKPTWMKFMVE